ncbi:thioredoxin family protein [Bacillus piscicola]|uniref:thioredoxin family protein n=1 Tax=Bacillus piscicola TaxID=1632684 RepID=UPI0023DE150A|nr:thioredoxin family protein [Bacillus piscicola]
MRIEDKTQQEIKQLLQERERFLVFFYTPLCGTCTVAEKMLLSLQMLWPEELFVKVNANVVPELLQAEQITSVPCLKVIENGETLQTIYAFHSVPALLSRLSPLLRTSD